MHRAARIALIVSCLALVPRAASASVAEGAVQFRVLSPIQRSGGHVSGTIEARALTPGAFEFRSLVVDRGRASNPPVPAVTLAKDATLSIPLEADVDDATALFELDYTFDGELHRWRFDLHAFDADGALRTGAGVQLVPGAGAAPRALTEADRALTVRLAPPAALAPGTPTTPNTPGERDITIHGRVTYQRPKLDAIDGGTGFSPKTLGVEGVTVSIYDNEGVFLTYLSKTETNSDGNFSQTFHWQPLNLLDLDPDITLVMSFSNDHFNVRNPVGLMNYQFTTGTWNNVGTDLDAGAWTSQESDQGALDILNNLMKGRNWYHANENFTLSHVTVYWPEPDWPGGIGGSGSWYNSLENGIHLASDRTWDAPTHLHEYGHFFIHRFGASQDPDYCNGYCDGSGGPVPTPWTCGHCAWCRETDHDAWNEGWADWIAEVQTLELGLANRWSFESESDYLCGTDHVAHDPLRTEGFLQALLRDVWDPLRADDPGIGPSTRTDVMSLHTHEIFQVTTIDKPTTTQGFIDAFNARYPLFAEAFYEVRIHNGFPGVDHTPPTAVTGFTSSSHTLWVPSPAHTVHLSWNASGDDYAGVAKYVIGAIHRWQPNWPVPEQMPYHWTVGADTTSGDFYVYDYGDFAFAIVAIDRDGNRTHPTYLDPIMIAAPTSFDLVPYKPATGWADTVVARSTNNATATNVPAQTTQIPGNVATTYWNTTILNIGPATVSAPSVTAGLYVDGKLATSTTFNSYLTANHYFAANNIGPVTVPGGRHSFVTVADPSELLAESSEEDNAFGRQHVWTPQTLTANTTALLAAPGFAMGWDGVRGDLWFNALGLRMTPPATSWWNLVWVAAGSNAVDYDCRLHWASSSPDTGFGANVGWSGRPAGCLDAVLVNRNTMPQTSWDVGVINDANSTMPFFTKEVTALGSNFGDSLGLAMTSTDFAMVREVYVSAANAGPVSVTLRQARGVGPLHVAYYDRTFTTGSLLDATDVAVVDTSTGIARLFMNATTAGYYGLVIWRDPVDTTAPNAFSLQIQRTPPDLQPWTFTGWHSAFVPRPRKDGTGTSVPLPDTLYGDSSATYLNFGLANMSPTGGTGFQCEYDLDGAGTWWMGVGSYTGWAFGTVNDQTGYNVRGGRHTLTAQYDMPDHVQEIFEDNNTYGEQYVWGPKRVGMESLFLRLAPPDRIGGWTSVADAVRYFNCDGWRTPVFAPSGNDGYWGAVAVLPASDVDLRLHEITPGTKNGFGTSLGLSGWGPQQMDFAILNFNRTAFRAFDAGVLSGTGTPGLYFGEVVKSRWLATYPNTTYGPFTLDGSTLMKLHEVYLLAGSYRIDLFGDASTIDWGLSLYGPSNGVYMKSDAAGASWTAGPGMTETMFVTVPSNGYYAVAAWRVDGSGSGTGTYRLRFHYGTTDAPIDAAPAFTRLEPPQPNPSRGSTELVFTLATPADVKLGIYDVRGARVRELLSGRRGSGEYRVAWDGRDERGRPSAPGVYLVRFEGAGTSNVRKLVRVQ